MLIIAGGRDTVLLEKFTKNGEWDLGDTKAVYKEYFLEGVSVPFSTVQFTIQLQQKGTLIDLYSSENNKGHHKIAQLKSELHCSLQYCGFVYR